MAEWLLLGRRDTNLPVVVYLELLARLYRTPSTVIVGSALGIALLGGFAATRAADIFVAALAMAAASAALALILVLRRAPTIAGLTYKEGVAWELRFWVLACGSSAAIGALCATALATSDDALVHLLVVALAMAAMAMALRNYFRPRLVLAQLTFLVAPGLVILVSRDDPVYWVLALGAFILALMMGKTAAALCSDAQELILKDQELSERNVRFDAALNNMAQGLCMFDAEGRLLVCNENYLRMYGFSPAVVRPGVDLQTLLQHSIDVGNHASATVEDLYDKFLDQLIGDQSATFLNVLEGGRTIALSHEPMKGGGWVTTHEDVTERKRAEAQIAYLARHDVLTGLPNRVSFQGKLSETLPLTGWGEQVAVLCLDLDRFKPVNDTLGHSVGDALLRQVAERLRACVRDTDTVARLGGDEFAIIHSGSACPKSATLLADRIVESLSRPFSVDGHQISIGTSIGIAVAPADACEADQLLRNADMALYRAKNDGRGQHRFFATEMDEMMQARRALELDLRRAVACHEFELHYQPLVSVASGEITGFEALLRWNHPTRGIISPGEFVPLAEEIGLIVPIGEWVLREACTAAATWPEEIRVAVNLSPVQFRSGNLSRAVVTALARSGLTPDRLELEITEGVLLADNKATLSTLHSLRDIGVRFAMDDFGTGYSSLSYLRSFPFDKIKIDQSFVHNIFVGTEALSIIRAVTDLGRNLGMSTTAEGIETEEQLQQLRAEGCSEVQGFHLGRPMTAASVAQLLSDLSNRPAHKAA